MTDVKEQNVFRAERSFIDNIFTLQEEVDIRIACNLETR